MIKNKLIILFCLMNAWVSYSEESKLSYDPNIWSVGLTDYQYHLKGKSGTVFSGQSNGIEIYKGYISGKVWGTIGLKFLSGPYGQRQKELPLDYTGTAFAGQLGYSAQSGPLRSKSSKFGIFLGLEYMDIIGRAVGRNNESSNSSIENIELKLNAFTIMPGLFYSWINEPRPIGNSPKLLMTRLEGLIIRIGIEVPIKTKFRLNYQEKQDNELSSYSDSGELTGQNYVISCLALLGS